MRSEGELDILSVQNTQNSAHLLSKLQVVLEYLVWILCIGFGFGGAGVGGVGSVGGGWSVVAVVVGLGPLGWM